jgi:dipeptidyl aminopeptidase/acylaminoacyl peptidase
MVAHSPVLRGACAPSWVALWLMIASNAWSAETAPVPHTVEELFRWPVIRDTTLSPDGKRVAIAMELPGKGGDIIMIVDAARIRDESATRKLSLYEPGRLRMEWVGWANDGRILFGARFRSDAQMKELGFKPAVRIAEPNSRRAFAIDTDGRNPAILFGNEKDLLRSTYDLSTIIDYTPSDPRHVVMAAYSGTGTDLYRVDVYSGEPMRIARGNIMTFDWETEDGEPALRYDTNKRRSVISVFGRDAQDEKDWTLITRYSMKELQTPDWSYAGDAPGSGRIYVRTRHGGGDTHAIHEYDIPSKTIGALVTQVPGFDMDRSLLIEGQYAGALYIADRYTYVFREKPLQRHVNGIEGYFRKESNVLIHGLDRGRTRMLVYARGPRAPGDYYLYDMVANQLDFLVSARPWLKPERLAPMEVRKSRMRDGTTISSYLTRPLGRQGPLPLVVLPHGGPESRDLLDFDPHAQALAAQGWLVLQPNFRGSSGYGRKFAQAGHRQWAKLMQDDLTDAAQELVTEGLADRNRIVIYGASYGGYAALAGAVTTPDLYRAAVSVAGPGNLPEMLSYVRSEDGSDAESYRYWVRSIGDPKKDKAEIEAASPELQARRIRIPILLAHGAEDDVVPVSQSRRMKRALERAGKPVEYVEFASETHGEWSAENDTKLMNTVVAFLKRAIEAAPAASATSSAAAADPGR